MLGATWGLLTLVVPPMVRILQSLGGEGLPAYTIALINTSEFLENQWHYIAISIIGVWLTVKILIKTIPGTDYLIDKLKIRIPIFGPVFENCCCHGFLMCLDFCMPPVSA